MKLETSIEFYEKYLPTPRHRKLREREVKESLSVDIKEVTAAEAPVALRTHDIKRYCGAEIVPTDYRQFNGDLYTAVRNCDKFVPENDKEANEPFPAAKLGRYLRVYNATYDKLTREGALKRLQEETERYLIVDGALWERTGEPRYQVCTFGLGHNHGGTALMITNHYNPNCRWTDYFSALHQKEAVEAAVKTAAGRGDDKSLEYIQSGRYYIEVLDPSAVKVNPREWGGKGDDFLNALDAITSSADSSFEAGLLAIAATNAELQQEGKKPSLTDQIQNAETRRENQQPTHSSPAKNLGR